MSEEIIIGDDEVFFFYLGELVLLVIFELVKLFFNIVGWLDGCFFLVCFGLMVYVIVYCIDLGWEGCIVFEFFNVGKLLFVFCFNMVIGVLSFEVLSGYVVKLYNV